MPFSIQAHSGPPHLGRIETAHGTVETLAFMRATAHNGTEEIGRGTVTRTQRLVDFVREQANTEEAARSSLETDARYYSVNLRDPYLTRALFADSRQLQEKIGSSGRTRT